MEDGRIKDTAIISKKFKQANKPQGVCSNAHNAIAEKGNAFIPNLCLLSFWFSGSTFGVN